jgi:thioredoxin 1
MGISLVELSDGIYVHRVSPNYPSFGRRGVPIKTGDKIIKINDTDISGFSLQAVLKVFADDSLNTDKPRKIIVVRGGEEYSLDMYKRNTAFEPVIKDLGEEDLANMIKNANKPLIVFFISDWCDECQFYYNDRSIDRPTYLYKNDITFIYANTDEHNSLEKEFGVEKNPTLHFYKNGKLVDKIIGYDGDLYREKASELLE